MKKFTLLASAALACVVILAATAPLLQAEYTNAYWKKRLTLFAQTKTEIAINEFAGFRWKKIYLLQSLDLTGTISQEVFGSSRAAWFYWWVGDPNYITLAITWIPASTLQSNASPPTMIRLPISDWMAHRNSLVWTESREAKISANRIENTEWGCRPQPLKGTGYFCLRLH